ncbi:MAG: CRTAC1 family protein, partial [Phycisphaerales bacterium]|nr:CRTAC1 family protein [Phycisphaerales bacterium]
SWPVCTLVVAIAVPVSIAGSLSFTDATNSAGLSGGHATPGAFDIEFMAAGAAAGDFDRDGDQDLFVLGGSLGVDKLYINNGLGQFSDAAVEWGVDRTHRTTGAAVGDYNNDGWLDIYVTGIGTPGVPLTARNVLYRNNGDGSFTDVAAAAGVDVSSADQNDAFGAAFGDYDRDGDLDLFVAGWYGGNVLFINNGDGTFSAAGASVFGGFDLSSVRGFAPRFCDITGDGRPELLLVADFFTSQIFDNLGGGTFSCTTETWGSGLDSNGMGNTTGDFDNNGLIDWYVTSRISQHDGSGNMLYMNNGATFTESSVAAGVNWGDWGWGADAVDFDHDGWLDLVATNGFNGGPFTNDPTRVWLNQRTDPVTFTDATAATGLVHTLQGRGLLTFDADLDGDRDILIASNNQPLAYFRNDLTGPSSIRFAFDTSGEPSLAPDGFGTRVELDAGGATQVRHLDGGCNYQGQSELTLHFGLGVAAVADEVRVHWADGESITLINVRTGLYTITARHGCPVDWVRDGVLDLADISGWIAGFLANHPQADLVADGVYDLADLQSFIVQFISGCQ